MAEKGGCTNEAVELQQLDEFTRWDIQKTMLSVCFSGNNLWVTDDRADVTSDIWEFTDSGWKHTTLEADHWKSVTSNKAISWGQCLPPHHPHSFAGDRAEKWKRRAEKVGMQLYQGENSDCSKDGWRKVTFDWKHLVNHVASPWQIEPSNTVVQTALQSQMFTCSSNHI